jgi:hypothetical protein
MIYYGFAFSFISFLCLAQPTHLELVPVDAGVEDVGAHSASFKMQQQDLRVDMGFEKLYRVAGSDGIFVRKSGGLTAVFQKSAYLQTGSGDTPIVPAGTVYYIGDIPADFATQLAELQGDQEYHPSMVQPAIVETTHGTSFFKPIATDPYTLQFIEDETYRRHRLTALVLEIVLSAP